MTATVCIFWCVFLVCATTVALRYKDAIQERWERQDERLHQRDAHDAIAIGYYEEEETTHE